MVFDGFRHRGRGLACTDDQGSAAWRRRQMPRQYLGRICCAYRNVETVNK
jgi:hypothetical protein